MVSLFQCRCGRVLGDGIILAAGILAGTVVLLLMPGTGTTFSEETKRVVLELAGVLPAVISRETVENISFLPRVSRV